MVPQMHPAKWWIRENEAVRCQLCPRNCLIHEGKHGFCGVRVNSGGELQSASFGYPVAIQVDPIEKKPLYHFLPGTKIFSIGTFGCNLGCIFCQNYTLSRGGYSSGQTFRRFEPSEIVTLAEQHGCSSIAFTYNEPTVFAEYAMEVAALAHEKGLKTVFVSNGYTSLEAAKEIYSLIDAANIDVKGFSEEFYRTLCNAALRPVLNLIELIHEMGVHIELTNLIIPGKNDSEEMLDAYLDWVETRLGLDIPLHFSAYHPAYKYRESPPTPPEQLRQIGAHAEARGFTRVHLGNI